MAIFKCPECGNNVSTSAECCPHCGMKFTVCPECGKIYKGQPTVCPNCGASLNCQSVTAPTPAPSPAEDGVYSDSNVTMFKIWGKAGTKNLILNFISDRKAIILYGILIFFACIGAIIYFVWNGIGDIFEKYEAFAQTFDSIGAIIWVAAVVAIAFAAIILCVRIYRDKAFVGWLTTEKYDYVRYLSKFMEVGKKTPHEYAIAAHLDEVYCFYLTHNPTANKTRAVAYIFGFLSFVTLIIGYMIVGMPYLEQFEEATLRQLLVGEDIDMHYEIVPIIIPVIVSIVLGFVEMGIGESFTTKKAVQWMKEQMEKSGVVPNQ